MAKSTLIKLPTEKQRLAALDRYAKRQEELRDAGRIMPTRTDPPFTRGASVKRVSGTKPPADAPKEDVTKAVTNRKAVTAQKVTDETTKAKQVADDAAKVKQLAKEAAAIKVTPTPTAATPPAASVKLNEAKNAATTGFKKPSSNASAKEVADATAAKNKEATAKFEARAKEVLDRKAAETSSAPKTTGTAVAIRPSTEVAVRPGTAAAKNKTYYGTAVTGAALGSLGLANLLDSDDSNKGVNNEVGNIPRAGDGAGRPIDAGRPFDEVRNVATRKEPVALTPEKEDRSGMRPSMNEDDKDTNKKRKTTGPFEYLFGADNVKYQYPSDKEEAAYEAERTGKSVKRKHGGMIAKGQNKSKIYKKAVGGSMKMRSPIMQQQAVASPVIGGSRPFGVGGPPPQAIDPIRPKFAGGIVPPPDGERPPPLTVLPTLRGKIVPQSIGVRGPLPQKGGSRPFGVGGPPPQAIGRPSTLPPQAQFKKGGGVVSKPRGVGAAIRGFGKALSGKR